MKILCLACGYETWIQKLSKGADRDFHVETRWCLRCERYYHYEDGVLKTVSGPNSNVYVEPAAGTLLVMNGDKVDEKIL